MGNARVMVPGDAVAFASAIVFATGITLVGPIYQDGANVHAVNLSRVLVFATVMAFTLGISAALLVQLSLRVPAHAANPVR